MNANMSKSWRWLILGVLPVALWLSGTFGVAQSNKTASSFNSEKARYQEEAAAVLLPVQKRYTTRLRVLRKALVTRGDTGGVAEVEAELERLETATGELNQSPIEGKWLVTYQSGAKRTYFIKANGTVQFPENNSVGRFTKQGREVLVDFGDNKLERFYWKPVLVVEHYDPKTKFGIAPPNTTGTAEKAP